MNPTEFLDIELLSDATFSRGEGTAGVVDIEVEHDHLGLPFLGGKTVRGLLRDAWLSMRGCFPALRHAGERVFGPEADVDERSILRIGDAVLDARTRAWIEAAERRANNPITSVEVLAALTDIRYQTSEDRETGAPAEKTLRSVRVVVRGLKLQAPLCWFQKPTNEDVRVLALASLATRHAGLARSRGRGHIQMSLDGDVEKTRQAAKGGSR